MPMGFVILIHVFNNTAKVVHLQSTMDLHRKWKKSQSTSSPVCGNKNGTVWNNVDWIMEQEVALTDAGKETHSQGIKLTFCQ